MKPHVICHMLSSVDGRILPDRWSPPFQADGLYERVGAPDAVEEYSSLGALLSGHQVGANATANAPIDR